ATRQITALTNGGLTVDGGRPDFSGLTSADGLSLYANDGGTLALPSLTSYTGVSAHHSVFQANSGGVLDLSTLTALHGGPEWAVLYVNAYNGGAIKLNNVNSYSGGSMQVYARDTGTVIDLSQLPRLFSDAGNVSRLQTRDGAQIVAPVLTSLDRV